MPVLAKVLIAGKLTEAVMTTQYTATNVTAIVDKFTAMNDSVSAVTISVYLGDSTAELVVKNKSIAPGATYTFPEIVGHVITKGTAIRTVAGTAAALNIRASGREIS